MLPVSNVCGSTQFTDPGPNGHVDVLSHDAPKVDIASSDLGAGNYSTKAGRPRKNFGATKSTKRGTINRSSCFMHK